LTFTHERVGPSGPPCPGAKPERDDNSKKSHIEIAAPSFSKLALDRSPRRSISAKHLIAIEIL
jgi:hypothetical protein